MNLRNRTVLLEMGDVSGCCRVVLWEKDIGRLKEGQSNKLVGASVHSFLGINYCDGCQIEDVVDIGETADVEEGDLQEKGVMRKVHD